MPKPNTILQERLRRVIRRALALANIDRALWEGLIDLIGRTAVLLDKESRKAFLEDIAVLPGGSKEDEKVIPLEWLSKKDLVALATNREIKSTSVKSRVDVYNDIVEHHNPAPQSDSISPTNDNSPITSKTSAQEVTDTSTDNIDD